MGTPVDCRIRVLFCHEEDVFGEYAMMARSYQNMVKEMFLKALLYNMFMGLKKL